MCDKAETNNVVLLPRERNYKFWDSKKLIWRPLHRSRSEKTILRFHRTELMLDGFITNSRKNDKIPENKKLSFSNLVDRKFRYMRF